MNASGQGINYLSVANRYRFMREVGTDECTQGE